MKSGNQNSMIKQNKYKNLEISLEPWAHEEDTIPILLSPKVPTHHTHPNTIVKSKQPSPNHKIYKQETKCKTSYDLKQRAYKKYSDVDFVKKNQKQIQSFANGLHNNYQALLDDSFVPMNPNSHQRQGFFRRPVINTTYIGYYEESCLGSNSPLKERPLKQSIKYRSLSSKRPRTTSMTNAEECSKRNQYRCSGSQISGDSTSQIQKETRVHTHHLQKVLKIKQKLRQKLKKNSQRKDMKRGNFIRDSMKISDEQKKGNKVTHHEKINIIESKEGSKGKSKQKKKRGSDNTFQFEKLPIPKKHSSVNFSVVGGSIYR